MERVEACTRTCMPLDAEAYGTYVARAAESLTIDKSVAAQAIALFERVKTKVRPAQREPVFLALLHLVLCLADDVPVHPQTFLDATGLQMPLALFAQIQMRLLALLDFALLQ